MPNCISGHGTLATILRLCLLLYSIFWYVRDILVLFIDIDPVDGALFMPFIYVHWVYVCALNVCTKRVNVKKFKSFHCHFDGPSTHITLYDYMNMHMCIIVKQYQI